MELFEKILKNKNEHTDNPIDVSGRVNHYNPAHCQDYSLIKESIKVIDSKQLFVNSCSKKYLTKQKLKDIWRDEKIPFYTKIFMTLFWGQPHRKNIDNVSSSLSKKIIDDNEQSFINILNDKSIDKALIHLSELYKSLEKIKGLGPVCISKLLFFFFQTHKCILSENMPPMIADQWILKATYIEMKKNNKIRYKEKIDDIFKCGSNINTEWNLKHQNNSTVDSYIKFVRIFNQIVEYYKLKSYPDITLDLMEGYLFNNKELRKGDLKKIN